MPKVFQLGYVTVGVQDLVRTREYYTGTLGMNEVDKGHDGASYLSIGFCHHDVVLRPADERSLLQLGFQLNPETDLTYFVRQVTDFGLVARRMSDAHPGIAEMVEVDGPGGNVFQFYESTLSSGPGYRPLGISPIRLGHVAVISPEADRLVEFYRDFLGFWETDWLGGIATFLTCNSDHHVVNILKAPPAGLHHIAFQLHESAQHGRAADLLRAAGIQTKWGPSRHTAGHNLAAYHYDPNNLLIELYTDMDVFIPELGISQPRPWHEHFPMKPKQWGLDEVSSWGVDFQFDLARG